ncbi:hypothetical protein [Microbacterium sp.]|uniref:hypothetical protein n=1 Tax=Microbacterium sp. TaxID=51671 RepID=UPI001AC771F5|nr:hypothetical protein [Microbacterium sp.]MBN9156900.1 hypothetical protein [Microbacterium sp.]
MPSLSDEEFLNRHQRLRALWLDAGTQKLYSLLPLKAQRELHAVYRPSEDLTEHELLAHRQALTAEGSFLLNTAGQHYKTLNQVFIDSSTQLGIDPATIDDTLRTAYLTHSSAAIVHADPTEPVASRRVRVMGIARPEIDYQKLAQVLVVASRDEKLMEAITAAKRDSKRRKKKS